MAESANNTSATDKPGAGLALNHSEGFKNLMAWANQIVASKMTPHTKAATLIAAVEMGRALKIPDIVAANHIYNVNGTTSVDVHLVNMMLDRAGVIRKILKYAEPIWEYRDNVGITYKEEYVMANLDKYQLIAVTAKAENYDKAKTQVLRLPIVLAGTQIQDRETVIHFSRKLLQPNQEYATQELTHTFKYSDAVARGLAGKDNWMKMLSTMLYTRCLVEGGRRLAADYLMGSYEFSEIADTANIQYTITEDGGVQTVDGEAEVVETNQATTEESTQVAEEVGGK